MSQYQDHSDVEPNVNQDNCKVHHKPEEGHENKNKNKKPASVNKISHF